MRRELDRTRLHELIHELAREARTPTSLYLVGGSSAVEAGWRPASIDADLHADDDRLFRRIQSIKDLLDINVELVRPERFVPPLPGAGQRHVPLETVGRLSVYHYDPYSQILSKIVRGFERDVADARKFLESGMVEPGRLRELVARIPEEEYSRYPHLSRRAIEEAVEEFLAEDSRDSPAG